MAGKFVLKKGSSGKYHFNLVAGNGQIIATSETYERKQSALNGIESGQEQAPGAEVDDQTGNAPRRSEFPSSRSVLWEPKAGRSRGKRNPWPRDQPEGSGRRRLRRRDVHEHHGRRRSSTSPCRLSAATSG